MLPAPEALCPTASVGVRTSPLGASVSSSWASCAIFIFLQEPEISFWPEREQLLRRTRVSRAVRNLWPRPERCLRLRQPGSGVLLVFPSCLLSQTAALGFLFVCLFFTSAGSAPALSSQVGAYRFPTQHRGRWKKPGGCRRDSCCLSGLGGVGGDIYSPLRPDLHLPGMQVRKPGFREVPHSQVTARGAPWPLPIKDALWRLAVGTQQGSEAVLRGVSHFLPFPPKLKTF